VTKRAFDSGCGNAILRPCPARRVLDEPSGSGTGARPTDMNDGDIREWAANEAIPLAELPDGLARCPALTDTLTKARVIFLGETNHFVHEKVAFRLKCLEAIARVSAMVIGEELSWSDGLRVAEFLAGDETALSRAVTFGYEGHQRADRDDGATGIFGEMPYPAALMLAEHTRLYAALRRLPGLAGYFGFDVYGPASGYADIEALANRGADLPQQFMRQLARVPGETVEEEIARLGQLPGQLDVTGHSHREVREHLRALIDSLEYASLIRDVADYEAARPAMAFRENAMKRRLEFILGQHPADKIVFAGHAFHLAKDDTNVGGAGVGPGGDRVSSLGHFLTQEWGLSVASIWMIYGGGTDCQPLPDLPREASYPAATLNRQLATVLDVPSFLPMDESIAAHLDPASIGHLYNSVADVRIGREADAVVFFLTVMPLQADQEAERRI